MLPANRWGYFAPICLAEYADDFFGTMGFPFHEYSSMAVKKHLYLSLASTKRLQCSSCLDILETLWGRPRNTKGIDLVL